MRIRLRLLAVSLATGAVAWAPGAAIASPGDLDPDFSRDGMLTRPALGWAIDLTVQPDGRTVVATACGCGEFTIARFHANGARDKSFGAGGTAVSSFPAPAGATEVAVQPDGKIVVLGRTGTRSTALYIALARFLGDGSPDPGFGSGGQIVESLEAAAGFGADLAIQPDGRIVVTAFPRIVARFLSSGDRDPSFAGDGVVELPGEPYHFTDELTLQPDGGIVTSIYHRLARLTADGELDSSFGEAGLSEPAPISTGNRLEPVALQPDGKLLVGATVTGLKQDTGFLVRYTAAGKIDSSFADGGSESVFMPVTGIVVEPGGTILLTGPDGSGRRRDFVVLGLTDGGKSDTAFGKAGVARTNFESGTDASSALALAPGGQLVVGGGVSVRPRESRVFDLGLARYELTPGPPDADADGRLDRRDRCRFAFGTVRKGCPVRPRSLSIKHSSEEEMFAGRLRSRYLGCVTGLASNRLGPVKPVVHLMRARSGRDRRVGRDRLGAADLGRYGIDTATPRGRFYAKVGPALSPEAGICRRVKSRTVRVP